MPRLLLLTGALLFTAAASAQEATAPDYSRDALLQFVARVEREEGPIVIDAGSIRFTVLGIRWKFPYLMAPLSGTVRRTSATLPDALALAGAEIAYRPGTWRTDRGLPAEIEREFLRIDKSERAKVRVKLQGR